MTSLRDQLKNNETKTRIGGSSEDPSQVAGLYDLGKTIGKGHYAMVRMARHVFTGESVAVKVIDKLKLDAATRPQMLQEIRLMKLVQHPNVIRLYEVIETQTKMYLVLELADGGDLYDYIMNHENGLNEELAKKYFAQILRAIQYCHKLHVVHRDLKPENAVFFQKLQIVKLTDFGFSNNFKPGQQLQTCCGSLAYSAPEILLGDSYDAPAVDIWSLGIILFMLICGTPPFHEANDSETLSKIMDCNYSFPSHVSSEVRELISMMLQRIPGNRASLDNILEHPWIKNQVNENLDELPLIIKEHLTPEEHAQILAKMVNGAIASEEEILEALERDEYSHITATYFLLAEKKLKAQRHESIIQSQPTTNTGAHSEVHKKPTIPIPSQTVESLLSPGDKNFSGVKRRIRQYSIVEEEDEEDLDDFLETEESHFKSLSRHSSTSSLSALTALGSLSLKLESWNEDKTGTTPPAPFPLSSQIGTGNLSRQGSLRRSDTSESCSPGTPPLDGSNKTHSKSHSSKSIGLNQIHEEREEMFFDRSDSSSRQLTKRFERRRLRHMSRTASCSSSEASDDDSEKKKIDFRSYKSDDENDDNPGGGSAGGSSSMEGGNQFPFEPSQSDATGDGASSSSKSQSGNFKVRQSRSLNRISELHVLDVSRDHSSSSEGEVELKLGTPNPRVLERRLLKIQEEPNISDQNNNQAKEIKRVPTKPIHRARSCGSIFKNSTKDSSCISKKIESSFIDLIRRHRNKDQAVALTPSAATLFQLHRVSSCCSLS